MTDRILNNCDQNSPQPSVKSGAAGGTKRKKFQTIPTGAQFEIRFVPAFVKRLTRATESVPRVLTRFASFPGRLLEITIAASSRSRALLPRRGCRDKLRRIPRAYLRTPIATTSWSTDTPISPRALGLPGSIKFAP